MYTQERELRDLFTRYGPMDELQVVFDHQSGRSRGFAFCCMRNLDDAIEVIKEFDMLDEKKIVIYSKALTDN